MGAVSGSMGEYSYGAPGLAGEKEPPRAALAARLQTGLCAATDISSIQDHVQSASASLNKSSHSPNNRDPSTPGSDSGKGDTRSFSSSTENFKPDYRLLWEIARSVNWGWENKEAGRNIKARGSLVSLLPPCSIHSAGLEAQIDVLFHLSSVISRQISDIQVQIGSELGGGYKKTRC